MICVYIYYHEITILVVHALISGKGPCIPDKHITPPPHTPAAPPGILTYISAILSRALCIITGSRKLSDFETSIREFPKIRGTGVPDLGSL